MYNFLSLFLLFSVSRDFEIKSLYIMCCKFKPEYTVYAACHCVLLFNNDCTWYSRGILSSALKSLDMSLPSRRYYILFICTVVFLVSIDFFLNNNPKRNTIFLSHLIFFLLLCFCLNNNVFFLFLSYLLFPSVKIVSFFRSTCLCPSVCLCTFFFFCCIFVCLYFIYV